MTNKVMEIRDRQEHDERWSRINYNLMSLGLSVTWIWFEADYGEPRIKYRLARLTPYEVLGSYDDEDTVRSIADLLWSQNRIDGYGE